MLRDRRAAAEVVDVLLDLIRLRKLLLELLVVTVMAVEVAFLNQRLLLLELQVHLLVFFGDALFLLLAVEEIE